MKTGYLVLIGAIVGTYYVYSQIEKSKNIMFSIVGKLKPNISDLIKSGFLSLPINASIRLTNPLDIGAKVNVINLALYYNNTVVGNVVKTDQFTITAKESTIIPVTFLIDTLNLSTSVGTLINNIKNNIPGINLTIKGFVDSNVGRLQLNEKIVL